MALLPTWSIIIILLCSCCAITLCALYCCCHELSWCHRLYRLYYSYYYQASGAAGNQRFSRNVTFQFDDLERCSDANEGDDVTVRNNSNNNDDIAERLVINTNRPIEELNTSNSDDSDDEMDIGQRYSPKEIIKKVLHAGHTTGIRLAMSPRSRQLTNQHIAQKKVPDIAIPTISTITSPTVANPMVTSNSGMGMEGIVAIPRVQMKKLLNAAGPGVLDSPQWNLFRKHHNSGVTIQSITANILTQPSPRKESSDFTSDCVVVNPINRSSLDSWRLAPGEIRASKSGGHDLKFPFNNPGEESAGLARSWVHDIEQQDIGIKMQGRHFARNTKLQAATIAIMDSSGNSSPRNNAAPKHVSKHYALPMESANELNSLIPKSVMREYFSAHDCYRRVEDFDKLTGLFEFNAEPRERLLNIESKDVELQTNYVCQQAAQCDASFFPCSPSKHQYKGTISNGENRAVFTV